MNIRKIVLSIVALCSLARIAGTQTVEIQKRPRAALVKDADGALVASIPIDATTVNFPYSWASNTFYILNQAGKSKARLLSAVNLTTRRVDRTIPVGAGNRVELLMSSDGRRLFCYTATPLKSGALRGNLTMGYQVEHDTGGNPIPQMEVKANLKPASEPLITVIDTASNDVVVTYEWYGALRAALGKKADYFVHRFFATSDGSRLVGVFQGFGRGETGQQIAILSGQSSHPTMTFDPGGRITSAMLSLKGRFLLVAAEEGKRHAQVVDIVDLEKGMVTRRDLSDAAGQSFVAMAPSSNEKYFFLAAEEIGKLHFQAGALEHPHSGVLYVVDMENGTAVRRDLIDPPMQLIRLGSQGLWVMSHQEMRSISETGDLGARPILLNKPLKAEKGAAMGGEEFLHGYPGGGIAVGQDGAAILILDSNGGLKHRVALLDLKQLRVDAVLPTMSVLGRVGEAVGQILEVAIMTCPLCVALGAANPGPPVIVNWRLAARRDGRFLYALDGAEITVIDVQTATVVKRIVVSESAALLQVSPDGKSLLCIGKKIQKIDLESNVIEP